MAGDALTKVGREAPSEPVPRVHRDQQRGKQNPSEQRAVDVVQGHAGFPRFMVGATIRGPSKNRASASPGAQSTRAPDALTARDHFAISDRSRLARSSGVPP